MGTALDVIVYRPESEADAAMDDLEVAFLAVAEIDQLMSLYKTGSELTALNKAAGQSAVAVSTHTANVLGAASHFAALSNGALDITVEPLVRLWGFFNLETSRIPPESDINTALDQTGMERLTVDIQAGTATLKEGSRIDLGSIAKGYGVDQALRVLKERKVPAALVNLGGTVGVLGKHPVGRPWTVGIRHPRKNQLIGEIRLEGGAVSTSGDYDRYFELNGTRYSHILDPRTGWPVEGVYSVTVVAPNATAADALSTAAFVMGPSEGLAFLSLCDGIDGLFIEPVNDSKEVTVQITGEEKETLSILIDNTSMVHVIRQDDLQKSSSKTVCLRQAL